MRRMLVEKKEVSPNGLKNMGNTCFMNTAIQCISQIFSDYFISGDYWSDVVCSDFKNLNIIDEEKLGGLKDFLEKAFGIETDEENIYRVTIEQFCKILSNLILSIQNPEDNIPSKYTNVQLNYFLTMLHFFNGSWQFTDRQQHDSNDFLNFITDILSKCLSYEVDIKIKGRDTTMTEEMEKSLPYADKIKLLSYKSWKDSWKLRRNGDQIYTISYIAEELAGQYRTLTMCSTPECGHQSNKFDIFFSLTLDIENCKDIYQCLQKYMEMEQLDEDNKWMCDKCGIKNCAKKRSNIWKSADHIVIHFKRFKHVRTPMGYVLGKNSHGVYYPIKGFDLTPYVEHKHPNGEMFDLCSVALHFGELRGGHYTCIRKIKDDWLLFDDSTVKKVDEKLTVNEYAYYLVYKRVTT